MGAWGRVSGDEVAQLPAQKRLDAQVVVIGSAHHFDRAALGTGPNAPDSGHEEIVPDGAQGSCMYRRG